MSHSRFWSSVRGILLLIGTAAAVGSSLAGCLEAPPAELDPLGLVSPPPPVDTCEGVGDGALCDDRNPCTTGDRCMAGACVGARAPEGMFCTDGNQCTVDDTCSQGVCAGRMASDGTTCTDGDPCTVGDTCRQARCASGPARSCNDNDTCTQDRCVAGLGCRFDPIPGCSDAAVGTGGMAGSGGAAGSPGTGGSGAGGTGGGGMSGSGGAGTGGGAVGGSGAAGEGGQGGQGAEGGEGGEGGSGGFGGEGGDGGSAGAGGTGGAPQNDAGADARSFEARGGACLCVAASSGEHGRDLVAALLVGAVVLQIRRRRA